jgi:hypothetical protein
MHHILVPWSVSPVDFLSTTTASMQDFSGASAPIHVLKVEALPPTFEILNRLLKIEYREMSRV